MVVQRHLFFRELLGYIWNTPSFILVAPQRETVKRIVDRRVLYLLADKVGRVGGFDLINHRIPARSGRRR